MLDKYEFIGRDKDLPILTRHQIIQCRLNMLGKLEPTRKMKRLIVIVTNSHHEALKEIDRLELVIDPERDCTPCYAP
jgi:hypothetical protein